MASGHSRITLDPKVLVGKPVIRGTRLSVEFVIGLLADGWSEAEILANYPGIAHEDVLACLAYAPSMNRVRTGALPWTNLDALHRMGLDALIEKFGITGLDEADKEWFTLTWHRLKPWPDSVPGLTRIKREYIIATLSNGTVRLFT